MIATFLRIFAAQIAPFCPAGPLPITIRSYSLVCISVRFACSTKLALFFLRAEGTFGIGFKIKSPLTMCNVWRGRTRPRTPSHLIVIPTVSESRRGEICSSPQNADSLPAERNHRPPARTSSLLQFRQQLRFQVVRVNDHLAGGNLFVGRPVKTQLADSQAAFCPHGRAKRAAHHRPGIVEIAQSGIRIEHRTGLIVRKLREALFRLRTFVEHARFRVAGKLRRQPPKQAPPPTSNRTYPSSLTRLRSNHEYDLINHMTTSRRLCSQWLFLLLSLVSLTVAKDSPKDKYLLFVGTYTENGSKGIYAYRFDAASSELTPLGVAAETTNPSFLAIVPSRRFLYAANEVQKYKSATSGSLSAFAINRQTGKLSLLNEVASHGADPCYVAFDKTGKYAILPTYPAGTVPA